MRPDELALLLLIAFAYGAYKLWRYTQHHRCPQCRELFAVEIIDEKIKNKRRKYAGYQTTFNVAGKARTRQRRVTTEYSLQSCVCQKCGYEFDRNVERSWDS